MRHLTLRLGLAVAATPFLSSVARAQEASPAPSSFTTRTCTESGTGSYDACALFLEGRQLKRGSLGTVVATPGYWRPLPLVAEVGGDSAIWYARRFEHNAFRGKNIGTAGALLAFGGLFFIRPSHGRPPDLARFEAGAGMMLSGMVLGFVSSSFDRHAASDAARAIWWNNSRYTHP